MKYNVILIKGEKEVLNFWVPSFCSAYNSVINHIGNNRKNRAKIYDLLTGEMKQYFFVGSKLNISVL